MSILFDKQTEFCRKIAVLKLVAYEMGYTMTEGDGYRDERVHYGSPNSLHRKRLAKDLNIFKDGVWLKDGSGHDEIHRVWSMMGGADPIPGDANHYSLEHEGRR